MPKAIIKDTLNAKGVSIGIYTTDFENEFLSLTDIAKYKPPGWTRRRWRMSGALCVLN